MSPPGRCAQSPPPPPSQGGKPGTNSRPEACTRTPTAYATQEIVSGLVTNALRYGAPPVRLCVINDRTLTCEVQDRGISAPRLRHARSVDEGGRGLFICAQPDQKWGIHYSNDGKTVWTEQALPHSTHGPLRRQVVH
ncbi:ATP-binding protein [Streptomyces sp. NPDC059680]|uniref:ATP-binding protein n=1 Tax=Streptomyces sp. NPDC059680 TaxID=3346904 RepID=UPI00369E6DCF